MLDEYNENKHSGNTSGPEYDNTIKEIVPDSELFSETGKSSSGTKNVLSILTGGLTAFTTILVGVNGMYQSNATANISQFDLFDGNIYYTVEVSDIKDSDTLYGALYDKNELIYQTVLVDDDSDGVICGEILRSDSLIYTYSSDGDPSYNVSGAPIREIVYKDTTYNFKIIIKNGSDIKDLSYKKVRLDKSLTKFNDITYESNYVLSKEFNFTMDFYDPCGLIERFEISLEDGLNNGSHINVSPNPHLEQVIDISNLSGVIGTLHINIYYHDGQIKNLNYSVEL